MLSSAEDNVVAKKKKKPAAAAASARKGPKPAGLGRKFTIQLFEDDEHLMEERSAEEDRSWGFIIRNLVRAELRTTTKRSASVG
jgi:hypothetical protein